MDEYTLFTELHEPPIPPDYECPECGDLEPSEVGSNPGGMYCVHCGTHLTGYDDSDDDPRMDFDAIDCPPSPWPM